MAQFAPLPNRPATESEETRLRALDRYDILDTPPEDSFDRITRLARRLFDVPVAFIAFLDAHRQWLKSRQGLEDCEFDRQPAFCNLTIQRNSPLIVEDAALDPLFAANPFVTGEPRVRFYAGVPLAAPAGVNIGTLCLIDTKPRTFGPEDVALLEDLARVVLNELELRAVATTDVLTGILSRRAFMSEADRLLGLAIRHRTPLSCIVIDLDHFKAINDRFGHGAGDLVLRESTRTFQAALRTTDLFGRTGGEEFAVLLPHTPRTAALGVADKLRAALAQQVLTLESGQTIKVTGSFGVAAVDRASPDMRTLLGHADEALYAAKHDGRNRCHEWKSPVETIDPGLRRRVLKAGTISFNLGHSTIDCTVRSLSKTGAGLDVISTASLPDTFRLHIAADDQAFPCRVVTRKDRHLEVQFA